ncbi:Transmembrane protein [Streptomyces hygroscopicus subsp. limoneus]|nr:Transmembrane protein [Streptomyces hygroscopicus subsp. limoneus]
MEAGPRDTARSAEHVTTEGDEPGRGGPRPGGERPRVNGHADSRPHEHGVLDAAVPDDGLREDRPTETGLSGDRLPGDRLVEDRLSDDRLSDPGLSDDRLSGDRLSEDPLADDGPDDTVGGVTADGPAPEEMYPSGPEVEVELRPQRRLRIWQLAPIVGLAAVGSLMFAFPLAFDFGDSGAVIAMLGLLICSCAAGWGMMAARRVGYTWPGLPPRGSGRRPDWRVVLGYVLLVAVVVVLAVWRVARLR